MIYLAWLILVSVIVLIIILAKKSEGFRFALFFVLTILSIAAVLGATIWSLRTIYDFYHKPSNPTTLEDLQK